MSCKSGPHGSAESLVESQEGLTSLTQLHLTVVMRLSSFSSHFLVVGFFQVTLATSILPNLKVVLTNDDGWAVAQIRSDYDALRAAGFNVRPLL